VSTATRSCSSSPSRPRAPWPGKTFREIGDQAADLPRHVLRDLTADAVNAQRDTAARIARDRSRILDYLPL